MGLKLFFSTIVALLLSGNNIALADNILRTIKYKDYDSASNSNHFLKFTINSTKVGIFSSDVDGQVKEFNYSADLDNKNAILRNMKIWFMSKEMDTDNDSRDEKMHNLCMEVMKYPEIQIEVKGPLFLRSSRPQNLEGFVHIRGKKKPFSIELKSKINEKHVKLEGFSTWSFSKMEIPDPSIAVASVDDNIKIQIHIEFEIK